MRAIGTIFTNDVDVTSNVVNGPGCDGIFVIFSERVRVNRNTVTGAECSGINVNAASDVRIQHNVANDSFGNGIAVNDSTHVVLNRNTATGNCIGIGVVDGDDQGYGIRAEDFSGDVIRISSNTTNANNSTCPFGPETNVGGTGIVVGGMDHLTVKNNTASDNVVGVTSLTAGGIVIADFPNPDGTSEPTDFVRVQNNTAEGNSSEAGPGDLVVSIAGDHLTITNNTCDYGIPDPDICR